MLENAQFGDRESTLIRPIVDTHEKCQLGASDGSFDTALSPKTGRRMMSLTGIVNRGVRSGVRSVRFGPTWNGAKSDRCARCQRETDFVSDFVLDT
jgi:hypothetical protein